MLTGLPLPELLPRGLVEQGRPALETLRLPFATSVVGVWRSAARHEGDPGQANLARLVTVVVMLVLTVT